jgi:23S rRNA (guanosine2251-2'-O)-methyltransferase
LSWRVDEAASPLARHADDEANSLARWVADTPLQVEGRNPVREALRAGRSIHRLLVARDERRGPLGEILALARERGVPVEEVPRETLDRKSATGAHQGIIALVTAKPYVELDAVLAGVQARGEQPLLLLCDGLQDPHNLGALLRTADAVGAHGVVIPARRAVGLTAVVAKTSAGAVEHVPVCRVTNLSQTIRTLQEQGLWVVGADAAAEKAYWEVDLRGPLAVVVGGEGTGIGRLVAERCDLLVRLPMQGQVNSLNASVAGSLLLYEVLRQRLGAG